LFLWSAILATALGGEEARSAIGVEEDSDFITLVFIAGFCVFPLWWELDVKWKRSYRTRSNSAAVVYCITLLNFAINMSYKHNEPLTPIVIISILVVLVMGFIFVGQETTDFEDILLHHLSMLQKEHFEGSPSEIEAEKQTEVGLGAEATDLPQS
jgi:hypothetical protein